MLQNVVRRDVAARAERARSRLERRVQDAGCSDSPCAIAAAHVRRAVERGSRDARAASSESDLPAIYRREKSRLKENAARSAERPDGGAEPRVAERSRTTMAGWRGGHNGQCACLARRYRRRAAARPGEGDPSA